MAEETALKHRFFAKMNERFLRIYRNVICFAFMLDTFRRIIQLHSHFVWMMFLVHLQNNSKVYFPFDVTSFI